MSDLEPLSPEIAALLDQEKLAYPDDVALRDAVLGRVELAIELGGPSGGGGGGDGGAGALSLGARAVTAIAVGSFVAGGIVGGATMRSAAPPPPAITAPSASVAVVSSTPALPSSVVVIDPARPASIASTPAVASSTKEPVDPRGDLTRERELVDAARAALASGNTSEAIASAQRHAQRWPHGHLAEEREVVWIQALAAAGRADEADKRAAQFRRSFPSSMLMPAIDRATKRPAP